ncbi:hypothetical protein [Nocardia gipuzkoensis]|uniref:hypothetical protein n=1 Tax=Nocardia gipuzkoensis TaxID=2749991 RepID=UPI003EE1C622
MDTKGWFNHYDDPDEDWDDEPLEVKPRSSSASAPELPQTVTGNVPSQNRGGSDYRAESSGGREGALKPPQKSSLVSVEVGSDRLPTSIKLGRGWQDAFDPSQYGRSIMDAYHYALNELMLHYLQSGMIPPSTLPSLREVTPLLLRTRTYDEYRDLYNRLYLENAYTVYGPGYNEYDEPGLTVTATLSNLVSVVIDPNGPGRLRQFSSRRISSHAAIRFGPKSRNRSKTFISIKSPTKNWRRVWFAMNDNYYGMTSDG